MSRKLESVVAKIEKRKRQGKLFSLIVIAEGAYPVGGNITVARTVEGSAEKIRLGGVGEKLAREIEKPTGVELRCTVLGHLQRGGSPTAFDRILATRYGVAAANAVMADHFGCMVALQRNEITRIPIKKSPAASAMFPLRPSPTGDQSALASETEKFYIKEMGDILVRKTYGTF